MLAVSTPGKPERAGYVHAKDRRYRLRLLRVTLVALVAGVVGGLAGLWLMTSYAYVHAITHPPCGGDDTAPPDLGGEVQDVTYPSHDGLTLHAWYLPPQNGTAIILLPGLGGGREGMLREGAILSRHGYGLLMTELRSCVHPERLTTLGYLEARDLAEAVTWLRARPGVAHVGVLGYSLGGVAATLGAAQDERVEAVVAEGGFYDLASDITNLGGESPPWEIPFYYAMLFFFRRETGIDAHEISPISAIGHISPRPLLLIYGEMEAGETHPQEQLAHAGEPKDLWIVPGCGHGGYLDVAREEWEQRVVAFFDTAFPTSAEE